MDLVMGGNQEADLAVVFRDAQGNETTDLADDTQPTWGVSDETILELVTAEDGMGATVRATGTVGSGSVTVDATNDQGTQITGAISVSILAGDAVAAEVSAGEPRDQQNVDEPPPVDVPPPDAPPAEPPVDA